MTRCFSLFLQGLLVFGIGAQLLAANRSDTLDIRKTIINFDIRNFSSQIIQGKTSLLIFSKMNGVGSIQLDLEGLIVDSVQHPGGAITYSHASPELNVNFPGILNTGDSIWITVYYHGIPVADATWGGFTFSGDYGFQMGVGFNAQPHSFGRTWHPCFDNFVERSSYEFFITTSDDKMAVCNGLLLDSINNGNGTKEWHWKLDEEIPSYLASVAVCDYTIVSSNLTGINGITPAWITCKPADTNKVNGSFSHLQESFTMLESNFGPYLWPRVGYSLVPFNAGAMEHATNIHIGTPFIDGSLNYETLIAHELSHHWWGDLVTCSSAGDMWLNEGFASYCEMLHEEYTYGYAQYIKSVRQNHYTVLNSAHINDKGYKAVSPMDSLHTYGTTVYLKGADMLHTLRSYLGDSLFFGGLKAFLDQYKWKAIQTNDLQNFLSAWTGINTSNYFNHWILEPGFTHFSIDSSHSIPTSGGYDVSVFLRQRKHRSLNYYSDVPLEIGFYDSTMLLHTYHLKFQGRCMQFQVRLPFDPQLIVIDPAFKISDAVTDENKFIKTTGSSVFNQAKCRVITKTISQPGDSSFIQLEHHWVAPDRFKSSASANGYVLNDSRYWRIGLINRAGINGLIQFNYDASTNNAFLDSTWVQNSEDSIRLFYRHDAREEWVLANDSLKVGALNDRIGQVYLKEIKAGEYCFGIKRSNYLDPMQTDAPTGGCGLVTRSQEPIEVSGATPRIYPNPFTRQLSIHLPESIQATEARIMDMEGRLILQFPINNIRSTHAMPDTLHGLYLIQLFNPSGQCVYSQKLMASQHP